MEYQEDNRWKEDMITRTILNCMRINYRRTALEDYRGTSYCIEDQMKWSRVLYRE